MIAIAWIGRTGPHCHLQRWDEHFRRGRVCDIARKGRQS